MRLRPLSVLVTVLGIAGAAQARVAPMLPQIKPQPSVEVRERFHDAITRGLSQELEVVPSSEVRTHLYPVPDLLECSWGACIPRVASTLKADRVVVTEIEQLGKTYSIKMRVYDENGTELARPVEGKCEICSVREADQAVQAVAVKAIPLLAVKAAAPKPPDDGPDSLRTGKGGTGATPAKDPGAAKDPNASKDPGAAKDPNPAKDPQTGATAVGKEPGGGESTDAKPPVADTGGEAGKKLVPYRPLAYGAFGLAVIALVPTIAFGVYAGKDGQPSCEAPDPKHNCPSVYHGNTGSAAGFGVVAGVAAVVGGVLMYLDYRQKKSQPVVSAAPTRDGFAASLSLEF